MRKFFDELRTNLPDPDKNQGDDISPDGLDGRDNAIESEQPGTVTHRFIATVALDIRTGCPREVDPAETNCSDLLLFYISIRIGRVPQLPSAAIGSIVPSGDGTPSVAASRFRIHDGAAPEEPSQPVRSGATLDRIGLISL